jgi:murein DD-endopeptidase MepM/ murein hydrolase activator NlpD
LKRTFTQKVKQVPTCAADSINMLLKLYVGKHSVGAPMPTEVNRRACTSAAMIGLAISMSATGLLLAQQSDEAMAVEPVAAEPNSPTSASEQSTSVSQASAGDQGVSASATAPRAEKQAPVIEHKVKQGETLWGLSKSYEVGPEAIAASNEIKPSADLPVGQKLKIPSVNGIVHEVKTGETVETLSKSYGVKQTQLQASAAVSELGQLKTGESVTVPGNVNDLLKAKQDVALNNLKEKRNRLNDSLAELRSEESINLSESKTALKEELAAVPQLPPVTLPPGILKSQEQLANTPQPVASVPTSPVVVPVPTPEIAFSPTVEPSPGQSTSSVVIPVPTPEVSLSPTVQPSPAKQSMSSVVIPVPTPEVSLSPTVQPSPARQSMSSVVIPVPTPEVAFSPTVEKKAQTVPSLPIAPVTPLENAAKPQVPQPVVMQPFVAPTDAKVYEVKPGDTVEEIARRNGLSSSQVIQANGLSNPNLLRINQQLKIPKTQSSSNAAPTVALIPGIKPNNSTSGQQPRGVSAPTLAEPTFPEQVTPVVQTEQLSQSRSVPRAVLAQSTVVSSASPKPVVVVDTKESQSANSGSNPYIDQLRADILRMRQEYQQRKDGAQASTARTIAVPSVTTPAVSGLSNGSTSSRINPDFNPKQPNETLNAGVERRQQPQPVQKGPITIEVPPPEAGPSGRPDLLATAPAPADSYNPAVRTPIGQRVSPELPPLSSPDRYLPGNPAQFSSLIWPTKGVLTSGYGWRWGRMHRGIDIAAPIGTPVVAAAPGVVVSAGWNSGGYGNLVEIQHPDGSVTVYAHNNRILVRRGQEVAQGEQISEMGSTGRSTGPHCHFEVHPPGRGAVNPIALLPRR